MSVITNFFNVASATAKDIGQNVVRNDPGITGAKLAVMAVGFFIVFIAVILLIYGQYKGGIIVGLLGGMILGYYYFANSTLGL